MSENNPVTTRPYVQWGVYTARVYMYWRRIIRKKKKVFIHSVMVINNSITSTWHFIAVCIYRECIKSHLFIHSFRASTALLKASNRQFKLIQTFVSIFIPLLYYSFINLKENLLISTVCVSYRMLMKNPSKVLPQVNQLNIQLLNYHLTLMRL